MADTYIYTGLYGRDSIFCQGVLAGSCSDSDDFTCSQLCDRTAEESNRVSEIGTLCTAKIEVKKS